MKNYEKLPNEINQLLTSKTFMELQYEVERKSMFTVVGQTYRERWISAFIAWLLHPKESHQLGSFPLKRLLTLTKLSDDKFKIKNLDFSTIEGHDFCDIDVMPSHNGAQTGREKTVKIGDDKCSFDVALSANIRIPESTSRPSKLLLLIENKVKANEGDKQTATYAKWVSENPHFPISSNTTTGVGHRVLIYLTPTNAKKPQSEDFIHLNYQDFYDMVLRPCEQSPLLGKEGARLIRELVDTLFAGGLCLRQQDRVRGEIILENYSDVLNDMHLIAESSSDRDDDEKGSQRVSLTDLINGKLIQADEEFIYKRGSINTHTKIVNTGDTKHQFQLEIDGKRYHSPAAAGRSLQNGKQCNGWPFFQKKSDNTQTLENLKQQFITNQSQNGQKVDKSITDYVNECFSRHLPAFRLLERIINDSEDADFQLPSAFSSKSRNARDYSLMLDHKSVNVDENSSVCLEYHDGDKKIPVYANFNTEGQPRFGLESDNKDKSGPKIIEEINSNAPKDTPNKAWPHLLHLENQKQTIEEFYLKNYV